MQTILLRFNLRIQIKNIYIHCTLKKKQSDQSELSPLLHKNNKKTTMLEEKEI